MAECLFRAGVTRGGPPSDPNGPFPASPDFGNLQVSHPDHFYGYDAHLFDEVFYHVILKTWVPADGAGSATYRFTHVEPLLTLRPGDFLVFQGAGDGVLGGDAEMQVVLGYTIGADVTRVVVRS